MDKNEQKKLILKLSKELQISIIKSTKLLQKNDWDYNRCIIKEDREQPVKKEKKSKKKKENMAVPTENPVKSVKDPRFDWNLYLENCEKYRKHPELVKEYSQIGEGYWTMQEIVKYAHSLKNK